MSAEGVANGGLNVNRGLMSMEVFMSAADAVNEGFHVIRGHCPTR